MGVVSTVWEELGKAGARCWWNLWFETECSEKCAHVFTWALLEAIRSMHML